MAPELATSGPRGTSPTPVIARILTLYAACMRNDKTADVVTIPTFTSWDNSELRNRLELEADRPSAVPSPSTIQEELQAIARERV